MQVFEGSRGGLIKAWIDGVQVEDQARKQLDPRNLRYEPYGTNLLDATQAAEMVRYMLDGLPEDVTPTLLAARGLER